MNIKKIVFGLIGVTVLVGCKPTVSESISDSVISEDPASEVTSVPPSVSEGEWTEPEPVYSPTGKFNFTDLAIDENEEWYTIPKANLTASSTYWNKVNWTLRGNALRDAIHTEMRKTFVGITYNEAQQAMAELDVDPSNPTKVLSIYDLNSQTYAGYNGGKWNKEHVFPQSKLSDRAAGNTANVASDIANIFVADAKLNETRSNNSLGEWNYESDKETFYPFTMVNGFGTRTDNLLRRGLFSPTRMVRGEIARSQLYMLVMWKDNVMGVTANFSVETMLRWSLEYPPTLERDGVRQSGYQKLQHARNPFIDNRKVGCYIWGDYNTHTAKVCNEYGIEF